MSEVHSTAIIHPGAKIGAQVKIGPYAVIGPKVTLMDRVEVMSHAVVDGRTVVGEGTRIWPFASVGSTPQDLKYRGEDSELHIGKNNMIREYCNISLGTEGGGNKTVIGDGNLFMCFTHVAHDCMIGNECIFANGATLAGHVIVSDKTVLGGLSAVHQFCRLGELSMIAGGAMVAQDVPPFCMVHGDRATINGLNVVGLRRLGLKDERMEAVKTMYRLLYKENLTLDDAKAAIARDVMESRERSVFLGFLNESSRGVVR